MDEKFERFADAHDAGGAAMNITDVAFAIALLGGAFALIMLGVYAYS